jgi:alanyl-tRNA synthetase
MAAKAKHTKEEKAAHLKATKGFTFKLLQEYADKHKINVHTLRGWHNKKKSTKAKKPKAKKPAAKKTKATRKKPAAKKPAVKKATRKPAKRKVSRKAAPKKGRVIGLKSRVRSVLVKDFEAGLEGKASNLSDDIKALLQDVHAAL